MPRKRTIPDEVLLDTALAIVHQDGPGALSFASLAAEVSLASSTIVQRFGTKAGLLQAALVRAWDHLDAATDAAITRASDDRAGVVDLLGSLSAQYDEDDFADQLMVLREDMRDPALRARGAAWVATLADAIERRLPDAPGGAEGIGDLVVAHWQGTLTVWGFRRAGRLDRAVRISVDALLDRLLAAGRSGPGRRAPQGEPAPGPT